MARTNSRCKRVARASRSCLEKPNPSGPRDVVTTIRDAELKIVDALIEQAKKGNYQTAKFLFDYAGLSHQPAPEQDEPSFAQLLLERLGLGEELRQERENVVPKVTPPQI